MALEAIVIRLAPIILSARQIGHRVHHKMDVQAASIRMAAPENLILTPIISRCLVSNVLCVKQTDLFIRPEGQNLFPLVDPP